MKAQLRQVFTNLIENAIKYGRDEGLLRCKLHRAQPPRVRHVWYIWSDDGSRYCSNGCAAAYRTFLTGWITALGTGLGLAIAKHIINRHGGMLIDRALEPGSGECAHGLVSSVDRLSEAN